METDTIIAIATPPGEGALALLRISGQNAIRWTDQQFVGAQLSKSSSHTIHFGQLLDHHEQVIDEVLVFLFKGPKSYTTEDVVEISCHGSRYIVQKILEVFLESGVRLAQPGEFTQRAFLHGRMDLTQAEAVADLIASSTEASHQLALQQMRGGVSSEIKELRKKLIDFASLIELELDFSEEDVEFADRKELIALVQGISTSIASLVRSFKLGNAIKEGVLTVIAGRPNAGKSTLLNRLLAEDRAIVSEIPGTTRDTIEEKVNIQGVSFLFVDTAGLRETTDHIEEIGVGKTFEKLRKATIILYLFDASKTTNAELRAELSKLPTGNVELLVIANKMDRNPYAKVEEFISPAFREDQYIPISALNNMNIEYLKERLYELATGGDLNKQSTIISNARHFSALQQTQSHLQKVLEGYAQGVSSDFIAMDIRQAAYHLGEITGEISTDDLLENIFRNFCIGK